MSGPSPFAAEPRLAARWARLVADLGPAFPGRLKATLAVTGQDATHPSAVIPAPAVARLVMELGLESPEEVMVLALDVARALARPPISGYRVGAAGLAAVSGDIILGGNLELPGASIWHTVHGEGFVTLVARARGELLRTLATAQARPCAHCRQVLAEMDGAHGSADRPDGLLLIDPEGRRLRLADVYPWPFGPADLGMDGAIPGSRPFADLVLGDTSLPDDVRAALLEAGARSHAPYSRAPAAVVLRCGDGMLVAGSVLESVAFNPTIGPLQDALVGLLASGRDLGDVTGAWLAVASGAPVSHSAVARDAFAATAPGSDLHVTYWA